MQENQWIKDWLPATRSISTRSMEPGPHERAAVASAANHFTLAVSKLAKEIEDGQNGPKDNARAIATTAAVLDNYVCHIAEYVGLPDDEDDHDEWDDPTPEDLLVKAQLGLARSAADALAEHAQKLLLDAGLPFSQSDNRPYAERDTAQETKLYQQLTQYADTASAVGHSAATTWLIDKLHEQHDTDEPSQKAALVLAMWPNEDPLMRLRNRSLPQQAKDAVNDAVAELMDCVWCIEEHRPVFVTPLAEPQWHDGRAKELASEFPNVGPEAEAMYSWEDDDTQQAIMAYRRQGSTHVKLVREPYDHPISMEDALAHCHSLEISTTELREYEEPEGPPTQAIRNMLAMAAINRTLALLGYQSESHAPLTRAVRIATQHGDATQAYNLINAIYDEQAQAVFAVAEAHGLDKSLLTDTQAQEAVEAARAAGASDDALRHMTSILGIPEDDIHRMDIPETKPISWEHAQEIIQNVCDTYPPVDQEKWDRITAVIGWPPDHPAVRRLRQTMTGKAINSL